jgi:hypothetical protein
MKPSTAAAIGLAALFALAPIHLASAQESPESPPAAGEESEGGIVAGDVDAFDASSPFLPGEQTISLSAGAQLPLFMAPDTREIDEAKLKLGGSFSFGYQYFLARGFAIGGTIAGAFNGTIGGRSLFIAPLSFKTAYWWSLLPFELSVGAELGGYLLRLGDKGMLGPFAKVGGGAYWRSASAWSVGIQSYLWLVPEIHYGDYADLTRTGGQVEISAIAVYHL